MEHRSNDHEECLIVCVNNLLNNLLTHLFTQYLYWYWTLVYIFQIDGSVSFPIFYRSEFTFQKKF